MDREETKGGGIFKSLTVFGCVCAALVGGFLLGINSIPKQEEEKQKNAKKKPEREEPGTTDTSRSELECPITLEIMRDPVVIDCGHSFQKNNIAKFRICPICRAPIKNVRPNFALRNIVEKMFE